MLTTQLTPQTPHTGWGECYASCQSSLFRFLLSGFSRSYRITPHGDMLQRALTSHLLHMRSCGRVMLKKPFLSWQRHTQIRPSHPWTVFRIPLHHRSKPHKNTDTCPIGGILSLKSPCQPGANTTISVQVPRCICIYTHTYTPAVIELFDRFESESKIPGNKTASPTTSFTILP
jgi:hypothetical protein